MRSQHEPIQAVLFDVGGTLLQVKPSVGAVYAETAAIHGFQVNPEVIERNFKVAWQLSLERSRARGYVSSDEILRQEWLEIVRRTFEEAVPPSRIGALFEDLYERFVSPRAWALVQGARETLEYLRGCGLRLGIVSNWDSRLPRVLEQLEIENAFDFCVVSYEVGFEKPHVEIFREALRRAGTEPASTLYVGDSFHADIEPARSLGVSTFWVAPQEERDEAGYSGPGGERFPGVSSLLWKTILEP